MHSADAPNSKLWILKLELLLFKKQIIADAVSAQRTQRTTKMGHAVGPLTGTLRAIIMILQATHTTHCFVWLQTKVKVHHLEATTIPIEVVEVVEVVVEVEVDVAVEDVVVVASQLHKAIS